MSLLSIRSRRDYYIFNPALYLRYCAATPQGKRSTIASEAIPQVCSQRHN